MLKKIRCNEIEREKRLWNKLFREEFEKLKKKYKPFSRPWSKLYFTEMQIFIDSLLKDIKEPKILEAGSGAGKDSLVLKHPNLKITLLDISEEALKVARVYTKGFGKKNVKYICHDLFNPPFKKEVFDLTWNIGTLEHYSKNKIKEAINEMVRVTKKGGFVIVGMPNPKSLVFKKAKILTRYSFLKIIPGYRNISEKEYSPEEIIRIMKTLKKFEYFRIKYIGSPLFVETPEWIIKFFKSFEKYIEKRKFLFLIIAKIK